MIPLDGVVAEGEAMVNQASLTGESVPVKKGPGAAVYAGTVLEEGALTIEVRSTQGGTRYEKNCGHDRGVGASEIPLEGKAAHLADKLVPISFFGTVLTGLLYAQCAEDRVHFNGGFLACAEALYAAGRAERHARVQPSPHYGEGRPVSGGAGRGGHRRVRQNGHADKGAAYGARGGDVRRRAAQADAARSGLPGRAFFRTLLPAPWCVVPPRRGWRRRRCTPA